MIFGLRYLKKVPKIIGAFYKKLAWNLKKSVFCDFWNFFVLSSVNISTTGVFLDMRFFWGDSVIRTTNSNERMQNHCFAFLGNLAWILKKGCFLRLFAIFCTVRCKYFKNQYLPRHVNFLTDRKSLELQFLKKSKNRWFPFF